MATHEHIYNQRAVGVAKAVKKRLFVFCDGTWQDGVNKIRPLTNVATLARCLAPFDEDGCLQIVYYDGGVGNSTGVLSRLIDGATGRGISAKIRNAYSFLSHNYNFERGWDETVLVGFSRGAFAVQCLASFISDAGLLQKQHLYYLRGLYTLWSLREVEGGEAKFREAKKLLIDAGVLHQATITACAVWDTVSALGSRIQLPPRPLAFVGWKVPSGVRNAFHALALDEERREFRPVLWEELGADPEADVSQCWFLGSHSDVGGSGDAALGAITLLWMVGKLHDKIGVSFNEAEIAKHLKHKFLEWDFAVSKLFKTFQETRTLSLRKHTGQPTPSAWYWTILGRRSRAPYVRKSRFLPTDVHFSVRLAMAKGPQSSGPLKAWSTRWASSPDSGETVIQWEPPLPRPGRWARKKNTNQAHDTPRPLKTPTLTEHPLDPRDKEYKLVKKWSQNSFPMENTDRSKFVQLEESLQEDAANAALNEVADLFKNYMNFGEDGKLAPNTLYNSREERKNDTGRGGGPQTQI